MKVLLKMYMAIAAGVVVLIAAVTIPIAICKTTPASVNTVDLPQSTESAQAAFQEISQTSDGGLLLAAIHFLVSRKIQGELPGIAADEHVAIDFPWLVRGTNDGAWHFSGTNVGNYPIALTLTVHAANSYNRYCYTVSKASITNNWQLEKAWLSDTNQRLVKEFSVQ